MIRQAISCDICGAEMLNANHWFIAYNRGPELRIGTWSPNKRPRAATRHLCGHKCLHKLVDDFMAKTLNVPAGENKATAMAEVQRTDTSLVARAAFSLRPLPVIGSCVRDVESSARLLTQPAPVADRASSPYMMHADAWKRERERQRLADETAPVRRSIA